MNSHGTSLPRADWVLRCSDRLRARWRVEADERDEIAAELWSDERWRAMEPEDAAAEWLQAEAPWQGDGWPSEASACGQAASHSR
jgi:hypothetical protein